MMKILLAEDEPPILRDLKFQIEQASDLFCVCASAYNGKQAMEYLDDPTLKIGRASCRERVLAGV